MFSRQQKAADGYQVWCRECFRDYFRENRTWDTPAQRAFRRSEEERKKISARKAVRRAVTQGRIVVPPYCERCGEPGKLQAHHPDGYEGENRLRVQFLCELKCHGEADHPTVVKLRKPKKGKKAA
jgi:hypothetical protein